MAPEPAWQRQHIPARFEAYVYGSRMETTG